MKFRFGTILQRTGKGPINANPRTRLDALSTFFPPPLIALSAHCRESGNPGNGRKRRKNGCPPFSRIKSGGQELEGLHIDASPELNRTPRWAIWATGFAARARHWLGASTMQVIPCRVGEPLSKRFAFRDVKAR